MSEEAELMIRNGGSNKINDCIIDDPFKDFGCTAQERDRSVVTDDGFIPTCG